MTDGDIVNISMNEGLELGVQYVHTTGVTLASFPWQAYSGTDIAATYFT